MCVYVYGRLIHFMYFLKCEGKDQGLIRYEIIYNSMGIMLCSQLKKDLVVYSFKVFLVVRNYSEKSVYNKVRGDRAYESKVIIVT